MSKNKKTTIFKNKKREEKRVLADNIEFVDNEPVVEELVEIQEPITVVEESVKHQDVVETSTESVLLEEDLKEENEESTVEVPTEEPFVEIEDTKETLEEKIINAIKERFNIKHHE